MPSFVNGYEQYGVSDLAAIHAVGLMEFQSGDPRFKRQTFALRIGYDGSHYNGYQMQKGIDGVVTVEDDIESALGRKVVAAGRTDKDVSAVSQMISFSTFDNISADDILNQFRNSEASKSGFLAVYDCKRVPKRFHALFSATWRRYLYVFPLNSGSFEGVDVDCPFVNSCLNKLENLSLSFNGFAHRDIRESAGTTNDICILQRAIAYMIDLTTLQRCDADSTRASEGHFALCVELVGSRFLRRMVRLIVGTAIRESVLDSAERNENILLDIATSGDRRRASLSVPGVGLALCGVGYNLEDLKNFKHRPCATGKFSSHADDGLNQTSSSSKGKGKGKRAVTSFFDDTNEISDEEIDETILVTDNGSIQSKLPKECLEGKGDEMDSFGELCER